MPTGGIEPNTHCFEDWFNAGVSCIGMGSQLFDKNKIANKEFTSLQKDIENAVNLAKLYNK